MLSIKEDKVRTSSQLSMTPYRAKSPRIGSATTKKLTMDPVDTAIKYLPPRRKPITFLEMSEKDKILVAAHKGTQEPIFGAVQFKALAEERADLVNKLEMKERVRDVRKTILSEKKDTFGHAVINFNLFVEDMERKQARVIEQFKKLRLERLDWERKIVFVHHERLYVEWKRNLMVKAITKYSVLDRFLDDVMKCVDESMREPMQLVDRHMTLTLSIQEQMERYMLLLEQLEAAKDMLTALETTMAQNILDLRNKVVLLKQHLYEAKTEGMFLVALKDSEHRHDDAQTVSSYNVKMAVQNIADILCNFRPYTRNKVRDCQDELDYVTAIAEILQDYQEITQEWELSRDHKITRRLRADSRKVTTLRSSLVLRDEAEETKEGSDEDQG